MAMPTMNVLDRVVHWLSPSAGVRRVQARAAAQAVMQYDAASRGRRTADWRAPGTAPDAAAENARPHLRNLSRDFMRNRPYAARARDVIVVNVVGSGISWAVRETDTDAREKVTAVLVRHFGTTAIDAKGELDLAEMQAVVMSGVVTDGEVLCRRRMRNRTQMAGQLALPFQVELLEPDFLDTSVTANGKNRVIEGIEYGPFGDIEAYWLFDEHPGVSIARGLPKSRRVPWQDVLHVRRFERPGQLRGVPWLAPVMLTMGDLSAYQEAQILKQRMAALMAFIVEWTEGQGPSQADLAMRGLEALEPGAVVSAPPGGKVVPTQPPQVAGYEEFMRQGLRTIAMGMNITYESLSGDLDRTTYSSGRMGRMEMDRCVEQWQHHLMIGQFCAGIARWAAEAWPMQAVLPEYSLSLQWTAPRRALIDPEGEIAASVDAIEAGLSSRQREQRKMGHDPDEILRERVEDAGRDAAARLAGASGDSQPGTGEAAGGGQSAAQAARETRRAARRKEV